MDNTDVPQTIAYARIMMDSAHGDPTATYVAMFASALPGFLADPMPTATVEALPPSSFPFAPATVEAELVALTDQLDAPDPAKVLTVLGTAVGDQWATWHGPGDAPAVPLPL